jgi:AcrR family transcriptional regulator
MGKKALADSDAPAPGRHRRNRGSEVVRDALINAAMTEFATHGFEGASTRRIAENADAHQSQIKYHFHTKDDLWKRCVELLLEEFDGSVQEHLGDDSGDSLAIFEATIRGLVHFAARRPELNRILIQEGTAPSDRLTWVVQTHVNPRRDLLAALWQELTDEGRVPPIDVDVLYHTVIGAATLIYTAAAEAKLFGVNALAPDLIERHSDTLVALFLRR